MNWFDSYVESYKDIIEEWRDDPAIKGQSHNQKDKRQRHCRKGQSQTRCLRVVE